ncbi:hypothetical protein ABZZ17_17855 [Streptomyces sp. NPDC006512]|uniref:hypothetical protein n=1 Tax=Streptomyces sp. NPDC006512 TaxID=3154307 RepID=UPI0033B2F386
MTVFRCAGCGTDVTADVREVPLPRTPGPLPYEAEGECPPRIAPGAFARDPEPSAFARTPDPSRTSYGPPAGGPRGGIVIGHGDARGMVPIADLGRRGGCCGPDGLGGANLACGGCAAELAIESADCWTVRQIVLDPRRVIAGP